jgi:GTP-binding protein EngB required for normal cell division
MLKQLETSGKKIVIVANKVDKIKKSQYKNQLDKLREQFAGHKFFPYSSKSKIGIGELSSAILMK